MPPVVVQRCQSPACPPSAAAEKKARAQQTAAVPEAQPQFWLFACWPRIAGAPFAENVDIAALRCRSRIHPGFDGDRVTIVEIEGALGAWIGHADETAFCAIKPRGLVRCRDCLGEGPACPNSMPPSALPRSALPVSKDHCATGVGSSANETVARAKPVLKHFQKKVMLPSTHPCWRFSGIAARKSCSIESHGHEPR
jgi:hypothetical protein